MGSTHDNDLGSIRGPIKDRIDIAIVGGGISGLCLALGILNQAPDINIHIYEAAPKFSEIGAGVSFGINAQRALWKLDKRLGEGYSKLRTSNVDSNIKSPAGDQRDRRKETYLRVIMGMDHAKRLEYKAGKEIQEIFCEGGFSSVHRAPFLDQLVALLPEYVRKECVTFGAKLSSVEPDLNVSGSTGVKLIFEDGRVSTADAVIGCDGIRSQLRHVMLNESSQPMFSGKYAYRGLIPMDKAVAALGDRSARNGHHRLGYDGHVLTFPIDNGKTMNVVAFRTKKDNKWPANADWIRSVSRDEMVADFEGWGEDVHAILSMMERCDMWALFDHPPASSYHQQGRICLIGDAAHASTPHQGSGAGMAVEDALLVSGLLGEIRGKEQLEKVFETFEVMRKKRTQTLVTRSRQQAEIYEFQAAGIEDDIEKIAQILPQRWDWIWDHNMEQELIDAKVLMSQL